MRHILDDMDRIDAVIKLNPQDFKVWVSEVGTDRILHALIRIAGSSAKILHQHLDNHRLASDKLCCTCVCHQ